LQKKRGSLGVLLQNGEKRRKGSKKISPKRRRTSSKEIDLRE